MIRRHVERPAIGWATSLCLCLCLLLVVSMISIATVRAWADAAPSSSATPAATATATPTLAVTPSLTATASPTPVATPTPTESPRRAPSPKPRATAAIAGIVASLPSTLSASSLAVIGFQYAGNVSVTTAAGPVQAMEFAMSTATFTGLAILQSCPTSKVRLTVSTTPSAHAVATTLRLDATRLTATIDGASVTWTVEEPPASHPFATGAGTLDAVSLTMVDSSAVTMSQPNLRLQASFC